MDGLLAEPCAISCRLVKANGAVETSLHLHQPEIVLMGQRHATWPKEWGNGEERESGRRQGREIMGQVIRSETAARINLWNNPLGPADLTLDITTNMKPEKWKKCDLKCLPR